MTSMMSVRRAPSMITIAPLGDDETEDLSIGAANQDAIVPTASSSPVVIKQEPLDSLLPPRTTAATTSTGLRYSNISLPMLQRGSGSTITLAPVTTGSSVGIQGLQSVVPVRGGVYRFTSPTSGVQNRMPLGKTASGQSMFLIPTTNARGQRVGMRPTQPIKLIPIQPKKTQAVVAPQTKQISPVTAITPQVIPSSLSKGILSFSQENPEELVVGRSEPVVSPKFGVSGMIFNSRTVTGGGRVKYTKDYLCNLCKHMSDSQESFKRHFTSTHMFSCDYCVYKAFSRYDVVMHTKSTHGEATEDLKGYEMFEDGDIISISGSTVTTTSSLSTITTVSSSGTNSTSGLITVPVMGMSGNKLILQNASKSTSVMTTGTTQSTETKRVTAANGYFTYKIVQGSKPGDPKVFECDLCQYQTPQLKTMYEHASSHTMNDLHKSAHSSTTWECFYCSMRSFDQSRVVKHVSSAHPNQHIQLKRYTSTSVIKPQLSAASGAPTIETTAITTSTIVPTPSLVIEPDDVESEASKSLDTPRESSMAIPDVELIGPVPQDVGKTDTSETPEQSKAKGDSDEQSKEERKEEKKTEEDKKDEEDDETAMWGCYYCQFEDQDRHNIVAHVKADHAGRKIVITRRRLQKDKTAESTTDSKEAEKEKSEDAENIAVEQKDPMRKDYSSLIIKLKTKTKKENKTLSLLRKELHKGPGSNGSKDVDGKVLPNLGSLIEKTDTSRRKDSSSGLTSDGDLEMPILEPMVSRRWSPRSPRSPRSDKSPNPIPRLRIPIGLKKDIKVKKRSLIRGPLTSPKKSPPTNSKKMTRVKSDLAFDQAEVVVLDHIPEDLQVDVSQLYVYNRSKQESECNICHRKYTGKMASGHMREHLMVHTGERIWGCPYCDFRCNRRFSLYMHVKKVHPDMPIKLVRRRPYQVNPATLKESQSVQFNVHETLAAGTKKLRGPRSHREKQYLEIAEYVWQCLYCSRKDVFKGSIKVHMKTVHPDQDNTIEPKMCDRGLDELSDQIMENKLPMKKAKLELFRVEDMTRHKILNDILEDNGHSLVMDLDIDDVPTTISGTEPVLTVEALPQESSPASSKPLNLSHAKYQCPYCSTRGVRPSTVKLHILNVHPEKELYIHDLRASRRTQNQHNLFVCRERDCKFMTILQQALYAHVAKNPTHVNPGLQSLNLATGGDFPVLPRVTSLRRRSDKVEVKDEADLSETKSASRRKSDRSVLKTNDDLSSDDKSATGVDSPLSCITSLTKNPDLDVDFKTNAKYTQDIADVSSVSSQSSIPPLDISNPQSAKKDNVQGQEKKKRVKAVLPANHREGVALTDTPMDCRYCEFAETTDPLMIKEHLLTEHSNQVPVAVNLKEKAKRKMAKIHMCPMTTCNYASYFETAFSIHLNEVHSDVFFPFLSLLKDADKSSAAGTPLRTDEAEDPAEEATGEDDETVIPEETDTYDYANSDDGWKPEMPVSKANRKRRRGSSDDEPEWKPNNRRPRKKAARGKRRSLPSRSPPKPKALSQVHTVTSPNPRSLLRPISNPPSLLPASSNPRSLLYKSKFESPETKFSTEQSPISSPEPEKHNKMAEPEVSSPEMTTQSIEPQSSQSGQKPPCSQLENKGEVEAPELELQKSDTVPSLEDNAEVPSETDHEPLPQKRQRKQRILQDSSLLDHKAKPSVARNKSKTEPTTQNVKLKHKQETEASAFKKKKRNYIPANLASATLPKPWLETITDFPSAVEHVPVRFLCFECQISHPTLNDMKAHLVDKHHGKVNFCLDLYARYMRKKQSVFICVQPECDFACKTWGMMRQHWVKLHPDTITLDALQYFDKAIENSPAFRKRKWVEKNGKIVNAETKTHVSKETEPDGENMDDVVEEEPQQEGVDDSVVDSAVDLESTQKTHQLACVDSASDTEEEIPKRSRKCRPRKIVRPPAAKVRKLDTPDQVKEENIEKDESENEKEEESEKEDSEKDESEKEESDSETEVESDNLATEDEKSSGECRDPSSLKNQYQSDSEDHPKNGAKELGRATMDVMYQCSHCTYLSTDKDNIQSHLNKEHLITEAEYIEIGAEFDHDGRVNMSVGEYNGQRNDMEFNSPDGEKSQSVAMDTQYSENNEEANTSTSSGEPTPPVSRIKPLKLSVKAGEVTKVLDNNQGEMQETPVDSKNEKVDDGSKKDEESSEEETDDEDNTDDSSSSEEDDSDDEEDDDSDDSDEDGSSESGSSEESGTSEDESKSSAKSE